MLLQPIGARTKGLENCLLDYDLFPATDSLNGWTAGAIAGRC